MNQMRPPPTQRAVECLLSKVKVYPKNWQVNPLTGAMVNVYVEDSNAEHEFDYSPSAKCILIKGMHRM